MAFKGPFQPKPFYDSMIQIHRSVWKRPSAQGDHAWLSATNVTPKWKCSFRIQQKRWFQ